MVQDLNLTTTCKLLCTHSQCVVCNQITSMPTCRNGDSSEFLLQEPYNYQHISFTMYGTSEAPLKEVFSHLSGSTFILYPKCFPVK